MVDLDESKKRFDETFRRLENLIRAKAAEPKVVASDSAAADLVKENAALREQLRSMQDDNSALKQSVNEMSGKVESVVKKLDQVLEAGDATA